MSIRYILLFYFTIQSIFYEIQVYSVDISGDVCRFVQSECSSCSFVDSSQVVKCSRVTLIKAIKNLLSLTCMWLEGAVEIFQNGDGLFLCGYALFRTVFLFTYILLTRINALYKKAWVYISLSM